MIPLQIKNNWYYSLGIFVFCHERAKGEESSVSSKNTGHIRASQYGALRVPLTVVPRIQWIIMIEPICNAKRP